MRPDGRRPTDHDGFLDLCAAHALGTLEPDDSDRLRKHLEAGCPACAREIDGHRETLGALAQSLDPVPAPPAAETEFLERIGGAPAPGPSPALPRRGWVGTLMPAAAMLIAGISLWLAWDARRQSALLVQENRVLHEAVNAMPEPSAVVLPLHGTDATVRGWVVIEPGVPDVPEDDWILVHATLPAEPEGSSYHAWVRVGGRLQSVGPVERDSDGFGFVRAHFGYTDPVAGAAISLEPQVVSGSPAGPVILEYRPDGSTP